MNSASEKRKTQVDFNRLRPDPRLENSFLSKARNKPAGREHAPDNLTSSKQGAAKTGKRCLSPEGNRVENPVDLKSPILPETIRSGIRAHEYLKTTNSVSPWKMYEKSYDIRLGAEDSFVTVAERRDVQSSNLVSQGPFSGLALVKTFVGPSVEDKLRKIQQVQDDSIVSPIEVFRFEGICYTVFEYMAYSLYYVAGNPRLDEIRLAAIVGQVLDGLLYLASEGLQHSSLTCSNILIHPCGDVKIANQECCEERPRDSIESEHIKALRVIVMELMQGYAKEDGAIGVDDLHRWPLSSKAVNFLSATVTATSVAELIEDPLLHLPWHKEMLKGLVSFVSIDTRIGRRYPPK